MNIYFTLADTLILEVNFTTEIEDKRNVLFTMHNRISV
jgi:hypothetical protein